MTPQKAMDSPEHPKRRAGRARVGVRTPWALANERVWNATHRLAAKTFVVGGLAGVALIAMGLNGWPPFSALMAGAR
jgi:hypothetical protein